MLRVRHIECSAGPVESKQDSGYNPARTSLQEDFGVVGFQVADGSVGRYQLKLLLSRQVILCSPRWSHDPHSFKMICHTFCPIFAVFIKV